MENKNYLKNRIYTYVFALIFGSFFYVSVNDLLPIPFLLDIGEIWGMFDLNEWFGPPDISNLVWTFLWATVGGAIGYNLHIKSYKRVSYLIIIIFIPFLLFFLLLYYWIYSGDFFTVGL